MSLNVVIFFFSLAHKDAEKMKCQKDLPGAFTCLGRLLHFCCMVLALRACDYCVVLLWNFPDLNHLSVYIPLQGW